MVKAFSYFFVTFFIFVKILHAYIPTPEGLFRNGQNKDITSNYIELKFSVEKLELGDSGVIIDQDNNPANKGHYKLLFYIPENGADQFIQIGHNSQTMNPESITEIFYANNFFKRLTSKKNKDLKRDLFYAILGSLCLNKSDVITSIMKNVDGTFQNNSELVYTEKSKLLDKYKNYVQAIKSNPELKDELVSPLNPEENEEKKKIKEIWNANLFQTSPNITYKKEMGEIFLFLKTNKIEAIFSNETRHIKDFKFLDPANQFEIKFLDYLLFDGIHELPKYIVWKGNDNHIYKIQMLSLIHQNIRNFSQIGQKYLKMSDEIKKLESKNYIRPEFLYGK